MIVNIWTDGSCNNSPNADKSGGWAYLIEIDGKYYHEDLGFDTDSTSSRMEMEAVRQALEYSKKEFNNCIINIHSDSAYVVNCFLEKWYIRWIENEWVMIKNSDLWKKILALMNKNQNKVFFKKVKGHAGIEQNERVDFLAGTARKFLLERNGN